MPGGHRIIGRHVLNQAVIGAAMSQIANHSDQRIVVVDDSPSFLKVAASILRELGFTNVAMFGNAGDALACLKDQHVDLLMTDLTMEPMDGFALADKIRHSPEVVNRVVPIMLMTGHAGRQNVLKAIHHGIDEVVIKPLAAGHLQDRLVSVFSRPRVYIKTPSGYFGPDRRRRDTPGYAGPERRGGNPADLLGERALKALRETAYLAHRDPVPEPVARPDGLDASFEMTTISHRRLARPETPIIVDPASAPQPDVSFRPPLVDILRRGRGDRTGPRRG